MQEPNFKVLQDKVAIMPVPQEKVTPGGIIMHESTLEKHRPVRGTVVAVGPGLPNQPPMEVKVGDEVIYGRYSGTEITEEGDHADNRLEVGGKWALMMQEREIFAVVRDGMPHPLNNRVLVRIAEAKTMAGSFHIPNSAQQRPTLGEVLLVGPGGKDEPMEIAVGDTVLYRKWEGTEIDVNGETMLLVRQVGVIAVIDPSIEVVVGAER